MKINTIAAALATTCILLGCGGGGGGGSGGGDTTGGVKEPIPGNQKPSETDIVPGGGPSNPAALSLTAKNLVNNNSFNNYFKYTAVAGERLVIRVNLDIPLSDTQFARCASNPGTGATPSSYASQIHVYNSSNVRIGGICGENLTYTFPETGIYVFNFEFPSNGAGFFSAASLKEPNPITFLASGHGSPTEPRQVNTTSSNPIGNDVFLNYYWISAVKGETLVVNAVLNQPLSTVQKTRCASSPESHNSQIYVYDAKLSRVGLACGESMRFEVPESGNYVFHFNYGSQSAGVFNAAKI